MSASAKRGRYKPNCDWAMNKWLNLSQAYLTSEIGEERVNALIVGFKHATKEDPGLWTQFYISDDPYRWLYERWRHQRYDH